MSSLSLALTLVVAATASTAHEVRPAIVDVLVSDTAVQAEFEFAIEGMLAGIDLGQFTDTNEAPEAAAYDTLRAEDPDALEQDFRAAFPGLVDGFTFQVGETRVTPQIVSLNVPEVGDETLPRDSRLVLRAVLPAGEDGVQVGWVAKYGPLIVRQAGAGEELYAGYLPDGTLSDALPRQGVAEVDALTSFTRYVVIGFEHIIPKGLDHILFVLSLFLFALRVRPLLLQVTAFTLAHTVTLALASLDYVSVPAEIVEPLIAASIVYAAVENLFGGNVGVRRTGLIVAFGLLHGLGFASVLGEIGLDRGNLLISLVAFNIGVEIGQLAVIAAAFGVVMVAAFIAHRRSYLPDEAPAQQTAVLFRGASMVGSLLIAAVGTWWVIERTLL